MPAWHYPTYSHPVRLEFGEFAVDLQRYELRRAGTRVELEPKVFDVLRYLLLNRNRVVAREELLRTLWPGEHVVDSVVTRCVYALRKALGQDDPTSSPLATVRGRGYRFSAEVRAADERDHAQPGARDPVVGRDEEIDRLERALASARAGRGRIMLLSGAPGIGKTRLAEEIADRARSQGLVVWTARCHELPGAPALFPWTQLLRACLRERDARELAHALGGSFAQLAAIVPELAGAQSQPLAPGGDAAWARDAAPYRLFDAVAGALRLATERTPHLVVLDDLHWADGPSLQLLGFLAPELATWSLAIVATLREDAWGADDPRRASLTALARERHVERISPTPLSASDVLTYVELALGRPEHAVADALHRRSEGNPFFMVELLRAHASGEAPLGAPGSPPAVVKDLVAQRVASLPELTRRAIEVAAVIGRVFEVRVAAAALELDTSPVLAALDPALAARLLVPVAEHHARLAFGHGLWCDALYDGLPAARRAALHARIARAIEGSSPSALGEIAHHYLRALPGGAPEKAVAYARRAAESASAVQAHDEAARLYADALEALAQVSGASVEAQHELLCALGRARGLAGRLADATEAFEQGAALARRERRPTWLALAALGLRDCQPFRAVPDVAVTALLGEALAALPDAEVALRARILSRLAAVRAVQTRHAMSARAAELAAQSDDATTRADVLRARLHALQGPGEIAERLVLADELVTLAERHAEHGWGWDGQLARYDAQLRLGALREADTALEACAELAERLSHPLLRMEVERHRSQRALCSGRYAEAEAGIDRAARMATRLQSPFGRFYYSVQMFWLLRDKGLLAELGSEGERFIASHPWVETTARAAIGVLHLDRGEHDRALACLAFYARERFENVPYGEDFIAVCAELAELAAALHEQEHAAALYDMLLPYAAQNVVNGPLLYLGSAAHFLGLLAATLGRDGEAHTHYESALAANARMDARPALVRTQEAYAVLLDRSESAERAAELRSGARSLRLSLGMAPRERAGARHSIAGR